MKVYPTPGVLTRDPVTRSHLPCEGWDVSDSDPFWSRRLRDGDVTTTPPAVVDVIDRSRAKKTDGGESA